MPRSTKTKRQTRGTTAKKTSDACKRGYGRGSKTPSARIATFRRNGKIGEAHRLKHHSSSRRRNNFFAPVTLPLGELCTRIASSSGRRHMGCPHARLSHGGRAHDLRSSNLYPAPRDGR